MTLVVRKVRRGATTIPEHEKSKCDKACQPRQKQNTRRSLWARPEDHPGGQDYDGAEDGQDKDVHAVDPRRLPSPVVHVSNSRFSGRVS